MHTYTHTPKERNTIQDAYENVKVYFIIFADTVAHDTRLFCGIFHRPYRSTSFLFIIQSFINLNESASKSWVRWMKFVENPSQRTPEFGMKYSHLSSTNRTRQHSFSIPDVNFSLSFDDSAICIGSEYYGYLFETFLYALFMALRIILRSLLSVSQTNTYRYNIYVIWLEMTRMKVYEMPTRYNRSFLVWITHHFNTCKYYNMKKITLSIWYCAIRRPLDKINIKIWNHF